MPYVYTKRTPPYFSLMIKAPRIQVGLFLCVIPSVKILLHIPILTREPREIRGDAGGKVANACEMGAGGGFGMNREFRSD